MVVAALGFASGTTFARLSYDFGAAALTVAAMRAWLVVFTLSAWYAAKGRVPLVPRMAMAAFLFTTAMNTIQNPAILSSYEFIPVSLAILIIYLFPILVSLASVALGQDRVTVPMIVAAVTAFIGLAMVLEVGALALDWRGVALALVGACALTGNVLGAAKLSRHVEPLSVPLLINCIAAPMFTLMAFANGGLAFPTGESGWWAFIAAGLAMPIGVAAFYVALPKAGPARAALIMNLEPLFTVGLAVLILGEVMGGWQLAGACLIIGSVIAVSWRGKHARPNNPSKDQTSQ